MNACRLVFCIAILNLVPSLHADLIVVKESSQQDQFGTHKTTTIEKYHGDWVRDERTLDGTRIVSLTNLRTGDIYQAMPDGTMVKSTYGERKPDAEEGVKHLQKISGSKGKLEWKSTGRHEKVGDWDTEIFTFEGPLSKGTAWVAPALAKYKEKLKRGTADTTGYKDQFWADEAGLPGIIVRDEAEINSGKIMQASLPPEAKVHVDYSGMRTKTTSRIVSIEEKELPASEFELPAP